MNKRVQDADRIFSFDFKNAERLFKSVSARKGGLERMRQMFNKDTQNASDALSVFINNNISKHDQGALIIRIIALLRSNTCLSIAEFKLAANAVKQEDATIGAMKKGQEARKITQDVYAQHPGLAPKELRPLVIAARAEALGEDEADISEGHIRRHLKPEPQKK